MEKSKNIQGQIKTPVVCVKADLIEPSHFMNNTDEKALYRLSFLIDEAVKNQIEADCMKALQSKGWGTTKQIKAKNGQMLELDCWNSPCKSGGEDDGTWIVYATSKYKSKHIYDIQDKSNIKKLSDNEIENIQWVGGLVELTYAIFPYKTATAAGRVLLVLCHKKKNALLKLDNKYYYEKSPKTWGFFTN